MSKVGHQMGKYTGYTKNADGSIAPAPTYKDEFSRIFSEKRGTDHVLKTVTAHCVEIQSMLDAQSMKLWGRIYEDYGLSAKTTALRLEDGLIYASPIRAAKRRKGKP